MIRSAKPDRRVERTRVAILGAFRDLVLTRGYDPISVRDIVDAAGVGRSTFYEHFDDKDDLFQQSLRPLLSARPCRTRWIRSPATAPGAIALTRTPIPPSSIAKVSATSANSQPP